MLRKSQTSLATKWISGNPLSLTVQNHTHKSLLLVLSRAGEKKNKNKKNTEIWCLCEWYIIWALGLYRDIFSHFLFGEHPDPSYLNLNFLYWYKVYTLFSQADKDLQTFSGFRKLGIKGNIEFSSYSNNKHIILYVVLWSRECLKNKEKEKKANACHVIAGHVHPFSCPRNHRVVRQERLNYKFKRTSPVLILS